MELKETEKAFKRFRDYVVSQSRANLTRGKKNGTGSLYRSISGEVVMDGNYGIVGFSMDDYGKFQDQGVKGANPSLVKNGKQKAPNSPFSFKSKQPPAKFIESWAKSHNIRLRNEKGQYERGNYKTIGFIIAKRIFAQGIKPSLFFTKPFEDGYKRLLDELGPSFGDDLDTIIDDTLK
jgi:hypothetical protein